MPRIRLRFGLRGAEVLARSRSLSLGDTSSTALLGGSRYVLKDFCQIGWTQANMSRIRVLFGLPGAEVLARRRSWSLGDTRSTALSFMSF